MNKIIYLFGAGASRGCLPIVDEIPARLESLIEILNRTDLQLNETEEIDELKAIKIIKTYRHLQIELIDDLRTLLQLCKRHASIDTAAKKLFIKGSDNALRKLKLGLSVFLVCEQLINPPDKRYDTFFASILGVAKHDLPKHIRILSWNYDFQFELSFMEYSDDQRIDSARSYLRGITKLHDSRDKEDTKDFTIFRLNGAPTLVKKDILRGLIDYISIYDGNINTEKIKEITKAYALGLYKHQHVDSGISFAWEREGGINNVLEVAKNNTIDAEIMVVIGYSFPFFNRDVDREIIKNMALKKVYFQSPEAANLIERFRAIVDSPEIELVPINDVKQFYLPNEL